MAHYTLACLIRRTESSYYIGDGRGDRWDTLARACLYTPVQAQAKLQELSSQYYCTLIYVIQDRHFNYYNGQDFVYNLLEAKLYSLPEAEAVLKDLSH